MGQPAECIGGEFLMADYLVTDKDLESVADSIRAKGGTTEKLAFPTGFKSAIDNIQSGGELPVLTDPAAAGDVIGGKEYIDGAGAKREGTLVVCDTVGAVETVSNPGVGLEVAVESTADGSTKILTLPEAKLVAENIVAGSSIFGVLGTAKTLRVKTGTFTLAEDAQAPEIIHDLGVIPDLVIVEAIDHDNTTYSLLGFMALNPALLSTTAFGGLIFVINSGGVESGAVTNLRGANTFKQGLSDTSFVCAYNNENYKYRAGWTYKWKVFAGLA